jgi:predicted transposase/invertase (TIGR01784 family)
MLEEVFDDLLRFVFPDADRLLDMSRGFEFLEKELGEMYPKPEKETDTKFVDKLVKAFQKDGTEEWILCHVEIQGTNDKQFAERMFKYYTRIFDRFDRPMTAIAIFTGRDGKKLPGVYIRRYLGTELMYKYNTLCILDYEDRQLIANKNPFALVILAAKKALLKGKNLDQVLLNEKLTIAKLLIKRGYSEEKTKSILSFLHNYVRFEKPETNRIFEREIDRLTGKANIMGIIEQVKQMKIAEAKEEGRKEGLKEVRTKMTAVVRNLIAETNFSDKKIADIAGVSEAFVKRVRQGVK